MAKRARHVLSQPVAAMKRHHSIRAAITGLGALALGIWIPEAGAYPTWTDASGSTDTYCADCHGDYNSGTYVSLVDGVSWGTTLMLGHMDILASDCETCHSQGGRFPVYLNSSRGGTGFDAISCVGCHGRADDRTGICPPDGPGNPACGDGAGLRQHHWNRGVMLCGDPGCHTDADPAAYMPVSEALDPPYYFTPDGAHPLKPTDPCNTAGVGEHFIGGPGGLDNDGDNLYDEADPDCSVGGTDCNDGLDNDGDGLTDFFGGDPGCDDAGDPSERSPALPCDNGDDDDSDGRTDFDPVTFANPGDENTDPAGQGDPGCRDPSWSQENSQCQDGSNNDPGQDPDPGLIDYDGGRSIHGVALTAPDPQCVGKPWKNKEKTSRCGLGFELVFLLAPLMALFGRRRLLRA